MIARRFETALDSESGRFDDCAVISRDEISEQLVWTIDPCPTPVVDLHLEPRDRDPYHSGQLAAVISLSDLAAMGARPLGMLVSVEAPSDFETSKFERFLEGLKDTLARHRCPLLGGNIRDGSSLAATSTAIGTQRADRILRRSGARPGDDVYAFGNCGHFFAAVLHERSLGSGSATGALSRVSEALARPEPKLAEGILLADEKLASAAMDASDGLYGALKGIASSSGLTVAVDPESFRPDPSVSEIAEAVAIDPYKLMLAWGNWELVFTADARLGDRIGEKVAGLPSQLHRVGKCVEGNHGVTMKTPQGGISLTDVSSARFAPTSYLSCGLEAYVDFLRACPLTSETA